MPTRKTTTTKQPFIPDKTEHTIVDVMAWLRYIEKAITQLSQVESATQQVYAKVAAEAHYMYEGFDALEKRIQRVEERMDTMTNTFTHLIRRLQTIIDLKEGRTP
jgi:hypothetical protein